MKKLAIIITHPIQYYIPVFQLLTKECDLKVFYTWGKNCLKNKYDPGFGKIIKWDIPMLDGYNYEFLENVSKAPGSYHGKGIINPDIINKIKLFDPNAILVYGYIYHSHFKVMRYFKGKTPIWFRGDSTLLDEKRGIKALLKRIYLQWIYSYTDLVFYVGANNKAYFKKYGLKENQLIFAPHAIDNERFSTDKKIEATTLRKTLGIVDEDVIILFAGKLEPKKNPEILIDAFIELDTNNMHLIFVGNGVLEKKLKERSLKKKKQIHFLDFLNQSKMPIVYQVCDIFCLPSQGPGETWGLAVNEAMAAGKPIIASDKVGCTADLINEGINGYIFPSNDLNMLKDKLHSLANEPNLIETFGLQSQKTIQNWSFEKQANQILKVLDETN